METLIISLEQVDRVRLLADWHWLLGAPSRLLAVTRMGDAFVEGAEGEVVFLDTMEGALTHAAVDERAFWRLLRAGALDATWFNADMVALMEARGECLAPGECYSYQVPPVLGGQFGSDNVRPVSAIVHFSVMGQLHRQIKDLTPRTQVSGLRVTD
jgi:hypothetical protein